MPRQSDTLTAADIDTFVSKLKATLALAERGRAVDALLATLNGGATMTPKTTTAPKKSPARPARAGRRTRRPGLDPEKVLGVLKGSKEPMAVGEVAQKLGEKSKDRVAAALRALRDQKKATMKGEKRLARWSTG